MSLIVSIPIVWFNVAEVNFMCHFPVSCLLYLTCGLVKNICCIVFPIPFWGTNQRLLFDVRIPTENLLHLHLL